jgi:hypothetical protein
MVSSGSVSPIEKHPLFVDERKINELYTEVGKLSTQLARIKIKSGFKPEQRNG